MKTLVLYRSKTGFVRHYAEWIAQALSADLFDAKGFSPKNLAGYDAVVFGGGLYAGGINGLKIIKRHRALLKGKKLAVFASGASPWREETIVEIRDKNFKPEEQVSIGFFYLRGGFDFQQLSRIDRILMGLMKRMLQKKPNPTPDEKGMLASYEQPQDFTKQDNIKELVAYIRS